MRATAAKPVLQNDIIATLPKEEWQRLLRSAKKVTLAAGDTLYRRGETIQNVYFPVSCVTITLTEMEDGHTAAAAVIGREGAIGASVCLGVDETIRRVVVQVAGDALRIETPVVTHAFDSGPGLHALLLRFTQLLISQILQTAGCNRLHPLDGRLCRWLLMVHDRAGRDSFNLTHESISQMLGANRPAVSEAAAKLQRLDLVRYTRGLLTIHNRQGLERRSCECYKVLKDELDKTPHGVRSLEPRSSPVLLPRIE
jgi:CRP-like cAMP-binding protein